VAETCRSAKPKLFTVAGNKVSLQKTTARDVNNIKYHSYTCMVFYEHLLKWH